MLETQRVLRAVAITCVMLSICAQSATAKLPNQIDKVLRAHKIAPASLSVVVVDVSSRKVIAQLNAQQPRNPASTIKVVTSWVALDTLGPAYTWITRLYALGKVKAGVLHGDLLIRGGGDPYLVLEELWKMLAALRETGIREIRGDLVIDDSMYALESNTPGAFDGATYRLYNVIPTAFTVNFNATRFVFNARLENGKIGIRTAPELNNLIIRDALKRTNASCKSRNIGVRMDVVSPVEVRFSGKVPSRCNTYELSRSVMPPLDYAFGAFKSTWRQWGGSISGKVRRGVTPKGAALLLEWKSRPLGELIRPVNKWSNNVMARLLMYAVGASKQALPVSRAQAAAHLQAHLRDRGLDVSQLNVDNGSGLSRTATVSADFMASLLTFAWNQPTMPEFVASMSIPGVDGTMRKRFRSRAEAGRMHIKTGLLRDVISAVGYIHARSGRVYAVAMLLNDKRARNGSGKALQEAVLKWTYAQ